MLSKEVTQLHTTFGLSTPALPDERPKKKGPWLFRGVFQDDI